MRLNIHGMIMNEVQVETLGRNRKPPSSIHAVAGIPPSQTPTERERGNNGKEGKNEVSSVPPDDLLPVDGGKDFQFTSSGLRNKKADPEVMCLIAAATWFSTARVGHTRSRWWRWRLQKQTEATSGVSE